MTASPDSEAWGRLFDGDDVLPAVELAERLASARDLSIGDAQDRVYAAEDDGVLVEAEEGGPSALRLCDGETRRQGDAETESASDDETERQGDDETGGREDALAAFADAIAYFHDRLDREIGEHTPEGGPDTPREYFTDRRGWDPETVEDKRLGYAPADETALLDHLMQEGHDRQAILGTGLFTEELRPLWLGRYVFPYFGRDGRPVYAISRCIGRKGGGAAGYDGHPEDYIAGKYGKLAHTKDYAELSEPIYGLGTLDRDGPVLITEGVADAIRAHEHGYACLSPVTTQFKHEHREALLDILDTADRDVYVVQDAERPAAEVADGAEGWDALGLEQFGPGLKGAVRTASYLRDHDVDAYLAELPRLGLDKVDLDDYLGEWSDTVAPVIASARPASEHPAYEAGAGSGSGRSTWEPDGDAGSRRESATGLSREAVEDALSHVSKTLSYDDWIQLGYAVHDWDDGTVGRHVFEAWSRSSPKWEEPTSPRAIEWIWENATAGGRTTVATLIHRAKEGGWEPPQQDSSDDGEEYDDDPREADAVVDPERAWNAAGRVEPDDLERPGELEAAGDRFACPTCGEGVDVVRAVAVGRGLVDGCDDDLAPVYPEAYSLARDEYGAPLPRYLTTTDAVAEFDAVLSVIREVGFFHLDRDALRSDVTETGDEVGGEAVRALNPAWRESESEASVLVFPSGTVWDADTERTLDALRFVALDAGMALDPAEPLQGDLFVEAYRLAREEYGAPLPRWDPAAEGERAVVPMLPPAEEIIDEPDAVAVGRDRLQEARDEVEALVRDAATDAGTPAVVTSLPATGKTTGTIKSAGDRPTSYLAPRKELQQQAMDKAAKWGADAMVLPVFSDAPVDSETVDAAVSHVREQGKDRLRDRWAILDAAEGEVFTDPEDGDEDEVDLDRATCATADGEHGEAWALVAHVARRLGYNPREIHQYADGLFGADLPCDGACPYSEAWERVRDGEHDLLVGSYVHAHVESVRTYYDHAGDGEVERSPRTVVYDEFPGEAHAREFGAEAVDHATWLARALSGDVADRHDLLQADLWSDEFVRAWLDGEADDVADVEDVVAVLAARQKRLEAREEARHILGEVDHDTLEAFGLVDPLQRVTAADSDLTAAEADLRAGVDEAREQAPGLASWVLDAVAEPLAEALGRGGEADPDALPTGELRALVERALDAADSGADGARGLLQAARRALVGGDDGVRALAAWADDGYAHPDAHHLLRAVITPAEAAETTVVDTSAFAFDPDATDGTRLDRVATGERTTTLLDRNHHGAILHDPPARTAGNGEPAPVLGLDATGRERLWSLALGERVTSVDIHDTAAERAAFLRDVLGLQVVQCSDEVRPYEGSPHQKDLDGDVALVEEIAESFAGVQAARERGGEPTPVGNPAVVTTKGVKNVLEDDDRLDDAVSAWENYGNLTGANDLGDHRLAALLGSQHYGDHAVERMAALAGEEVVTDRDRTGYGAALDYGSEVANTYLQHMREDQVMQAALRFARGGSGATVFARTCALRDDLPVVGRGQVAETWSETAAEVARAWRATGEVFTRADVEEAVDVSGRQVRRVLAEFVEAGYLSRANGGPGEAHTYTPAGQPGAGEVELPEARPADPGHDAHSEYYTWNVRVSGVNVASTGPPPAPARASDAPPAPGAVAEPASGADPPPG